MCSAVRVCATDVASENWIHSRATGAARKKNYEWMKNEWRLWFHEDYLRVERPKHWLIVIKVNKYIKKKEKIACKIAFDCWLILMHFDTG